MQTLSNVNVFIVAFKLSLVNNQKESGWHKHWRVGKDIRLCQALVLGSPVS